MSVAYLTNQVHDIDRKRKEFKKILEREVKMFNQKKATLIMKEDDAQMYEEQFQEHQSKQQVKKAPTIDLQEKQLDTEGIAANKSEQDLKEKIKKQKLEKEFMKGLDFVSDFKLQLTESKKRNCKEMIVEGITGLFEYFTPLKDNLKFIRGSQNLGIQSFF